MTKYSIEKLLDYNLINNAKEITFNKKWGNGYNIILDNGDIIIYNEQDYTMEGYEFICQHRSLQISYNDEHIFECNTNNNYFMGILNWIGTNKESIRNYKLWESFEKKLKSHIPYYIEIENNKKKAGQLFKGQRKSNE